MKKSIIILSIVSLLVTMPSVSYGKLTVLPEGEVNTETIFGDISGEQETPDSGEETGRPSGGLGYDGLRPTKKEEKEETEELEDPSEENTEEQEEAEEIVNPFLDVADSDWFCKDVMYVYENGIMSGVSETEFSPKSSVTRGMIITILHRTAGTPESESVKFDDVDSNAWYAKAVSWGAKNGVASGTGDGEFSPNGAITREQLAVMLYNYRQMTENTDKKSELNAYYDSVSISSWATDAVAWAVGNGIISGKGIGMIAPKDGATRAEAAAIIGRFMRMVEQQ